MKSDREQHHEQRLVQRERDDALDHGRLGPLEQALEQHHAVNDDRLARLRRRSRRARRRRRACRPTRPLLEASRRAARRTRSARLPSCTTAPHGITAHLAVDSTWWMLPYISGRKRPSRLSISACTFTVRVCGSTRVGDARDAAVERFAGVRHQADLDALAELHEADVAFRHLRRHPHAAQIGDGHHARARVVPELAGHDAQLQHLAGRAASAATTSWVDVARLQAEDREAAPRLVARRLRLLDGRPSPARARSRRACTSFFATALCSKRSDARSKSDCAFDERRPRLRHGRPAPTGRPTSPRRRPGSGSSAAAGPCGRHRRS